MIKIQELLSSERIVLADPADKHEALALLIEASRRGAPIIDFNRFREQVLRREAIVSTGIGQNLAIPHVKTDSVSGFFITVGVFRTGVDWDSLDGKPVHLAFLIAGPEDHEKYLLILSQLMLIVRNPEKRKAVMSADSAESVLGLLANA